MVRPGRRRHHGVVPAPTGPPARQPARSSSAARRCQIMRILLALDGSPSADRARALVTSLAWPAGTTIRLVAALDVAPALWGGPWIPAIPVDADELEGEAVGELTRVLQEARPALEAAGLTVEAELLRGRPVGRDRGRRADLASRPHRRGQPRPRPGGDGGARLGLGGGRGPRDLPGPRRPRRPRGTGHPGGGRLAGGHGGPRPRGHLAGLRADPRARRGRGGRRRAVALRDRPHDVRARRWTSTPR